jgi:DNA-directed RNA polymerase subunit RPC12/RpoP
VNDKVKIGVALLLLVGAGAWLSFYYGTKPKPGEPVRVVQPLACAACSAAYAGEAGGLPAVCEKCGKKEAYRALKCRGCNAIFPLVRASDSFAGQSDIKCTKCGKSSFSEVSPNDLQKP